MKNSLIVLSTFLLVCAILSPVGVAQQPANAIDPFASQPAVPTAQRMPAVPPTPPAPPSSQTPFVPRTPGTDLQAMQMQELRAALQELGVLVQQARRNDNPLAQELQTAVQNLTRAMEGAFSIRPATPPTPGTSGAPGAVGARNPQVANPLAADVEKAYIDLARQYFYLYIGTPDKTAVMPPVMAGSNPIALPLPRVIDPMPREVIERFEENGFIVEHRRLITEQIEAVEDVAEEEDKGKSEREEILDNFVECIKKISPAAQVTLISELIRTSHTNEELKLLEGLLDDVLNPPAVNRMPNPERPARPSAPQALQPLQPLPDTPQRRPISASTSAQPSAPQPTAIDPMVPIVPPPPVPVLIPPDAPAVVPF